MKTEATETTGRDDDADTTQLYRLICIHNPGKKAGRRISGRSVMAVVQKGEHTARSVMPGPEPPVRDMEPVPAVPTAPEDNIPGTPVGSGDLRVRPQEPAGNKDSRPKCPAPENTRGGAP